MTNGLKVISSGLLIAQMSVETSISGCTGQVLSISERNMFSVRRLVTFSQTKINDVNGVLGLIVAANQEVIRLNVSVDDSLFMDGLDSLNHLHSNMKACLEIKLTSALLELVLKTLSK